MTVANSKQKTIKAQLDKRWGYTFGYTFRIFNPTSRLGDHRRPSDVKS